MPRSVRKQINSESEEKIWQEQVRNKLIFNPSDMTTPSISMVPLKRPVEHQPETADKQLAVRLKKHMIFRPKVPNVQ